jgi:type II secretory pathway pseudopilin PulG
VSLNSARKKARIAKRLADFSQIQKALELYYDANNRYPITDNSNGGVNWHSQCPGWILSTSDQVIPGLVPNYMSKFPADPSFQTGVQANCYMYYSPDGINYKFMSYLLNDMTASEVLATSYADPNRNGVNGAGCTTNYGSVSLSIWSTQGAACGY